jgi:hypothetical protein
MATRTKRTTDIPVTPLVAWEKPAKSLHLHVPHKRRRFRGPGSVSITSAGYARCRLFWSAPIRDDADLGVVVALGPYEERAFYNCEVVLLNATGVIVSRCRLPDNPKHGWRWHRARFIKTRGRGLRCSLKGCSTTRTTTTNPRKERCYEHATPAEGPDAQEDETDNYQPVRR